jgi:hypothetical protein
MGTLEGLPWDLVYETRYTTDGHPFTVRRPRMPRIPEDVADCTVYLYRSKADAEKGVRAGGTGFLVGMDSKMFGDVQYPYVVTNKHVVRAMAVPGKPDLPGSPVVRLNTVKGDFTVFPFTGADWTDHPDGDDLSVCFIVPDARLHNYKMVNQGMFINGRVIMSLRIGPGDDVFQVGRFINHEGVQRNLPTVRFGSISMMPFEPIKLYDGHMQECFLVEVRSKPGYSGSPVFVQTMHYRDPSDGNPDFQLMWRPYLLGVAHGIIPDVEILQDEQSGPWDTPGYRLFIKANTGMEVVIPAWRLLKLLELPELVQQRAEYDTQIFDCQASRVVPHGISSDYRVAPPIDTTP